MDTEGRRVALVTGSSRGIGAAIVKELAWSGFNVVVHSNQDKAGAVRVYNEINESGDPEHGIADRWGADLGSPWHVEGLVKLILEKHGRIDVLVNNAGIDRYAEFAQIADQELDQVFNTNFRSAFQLSRAIVGGMCERNWGRLIFVSSIAGIYGYGRQAHYAASKAAMIGLSHSLAAEFGDRGITSNAIAPGLILTEITKSLPQEILDGAIEKQSVKRLGQPEDVARLVRFLCSDDASFITRQTFIVDGGLGI